MIQDFRPEKYVNRLNKQMDKYTQKQYLLKHIEIKEQILNPKKDICNYNDLLLSNPLERYADKYIRIKRGVDNDKFFKSKI